MGIRVHKMLGYGLVDLEVDKYKLTDPRVNPDGIISWRHSDSSGSYEDYKSYLASDLSSSKIGGFNWELMMLQQREKEEKFQRNVADGGLWYGCIHHDAEYGIPNVVCFMPLSMYGSWARYDDTIDYYQETFLRGEHQQLDWVEILPEGIFPFNGFYIDARTGTKITGDQSEAALMFRQIVNAGSVPDDNPAFDMLAKGAGFEDAAAAKAYMTPEIPEGIVDLLTWGKAFTDPMTIWQLKPMLYVYWA